ncbi:MAG: OmpW/AlkL family protein [Albimonas sp.]|uniref:OmpW/AlkL family protein n=1 Tax=Albimonas sp. TaxID=1872425 RepID=UPI004055D36A|tara:strand:+ start:326 stop:1003 length:678 start_codon:yes stop_codon:yes gene_type:complete
MARKNTIAAAAAAALLLAAPAGAEPLLDLSSGGDWLVRVRGLAVIPNEDLSARGIPGADASIDIDYVPELDISYFFTPNIAAELILATTNHGVSGRGALGGADIGSVWLLPPTLTLQYHVTQLEDWTGSAALGRLKPYVGAGVNYTMFYDADPGQFASIDYDNAFGFALQAGLDYEIAEGVYLNADVKYIFLNTDWTINKNSAAPIRGSVDVNPLVVGLGLGVRF